MGTWLNRPFANLEMPKDKPNLPPPPPVPEAPQTTAEGPPDNDAVGGVQDGKPDTSNEEPSNAGADLVETDESDGQPASPEVPSPNEAEDPVSFDQIDSSNECLGVGKLLGLRELTGVKKSLLVGVNYVGQAGELRGCHSDVSRMRVFISTHGLPDGHQQRVLTDEPEGSYADEQWVHHDQPTKENILKGLQWLVGGAAAGDALFFHFSGHGVRVPDKSGDEGDGYDETIVPVDYRKKGVIVDDILSATLLGDLPAGVKLTCIMDCCHSGSALDLPFTFEADSEDIMAQAHGGKINMHKNRQLEIEYEKIVKENEAVEKAEEEDRKNGVSARGLFTPKKKLFKSLNNIFDEADPEERELLARCLNFTTERALPGFEEDPVGVKLHEGSVVKFSGCADHQTSADVSSARMFDLPEVFGPDAAGGACTGAILSTLTEKDGDVTYVELLGLMRNDLKTKGFKQIPQLSSTIAFDLHSTFCLDKI